MSAFRLNADTSSGGEDFRFLFGKDHENRALLEERRQQCSVSPLLAHLLRRQQEGQTVKVHVRKLLPPLRLKAWLTLALPLALAFLIAIGGDLQHGLTSTLRSDASSLYAGAYGEGISKFPDLGTWLSWGLDPVLTPLALLIVTAALYARTVWLASLFIGVGTFVALTATDALILIFADEDQQISSLGVSVAANFLAACAIAIASVLALKCFFILLEEIFWSDATAADFFHRRRSGQRDCFYHLVPRALLLFPPNRRTSRNHCRAALAGLLHIR